LSGDDFYGVPQAEQVRRLGELARIALGRWSLHGAEVWPIAYRENMTFGVDAGAKGRFALRVHQAGYRTDAEVQSELDFMEFLSGEGILTPQMVRASDGSSFVLADHADVMEPRQCDLFEWIEGKPIRKVAGPPDMPVPEASRLYARVGQLAAAVYNASESWIRPPGFVRPTWDAEGIFGVGAHLGDFRETTRATEEQLELFEALAGRLAADLDAFGKQPDRYGLSQSDFLPENLMLDGDELRLIDFDDTGDSWILFDVVSAVWDLKLLGSEYYEPCLEGFVEGFRELRSLPENHLAMVSVFFLARVLSYLGHTVSRSHLAQSAAMEPVFVAALEGHGRAYLRS